MNECILVSQVSFNWLREVCMDSGPKKQNILLTKFCECFSHKILTLVSSPRSWICKNGFHKASEILKLLMYHILFSILSVLGQLQPVGQIQITLLSVNKISVPQIPAHSDYSDRSKKLPQRLHNLLIPALLM